MDNNDFLKKTEPFEYLSFDQAPQPAKGPSTAEGPFLILDSELRVVAECDKLTDLPPSQQFLLTEGVWTYQQQSNPVFNGSYRQ